MDKEQIYNFDIYVQHEKYYNDDTNWGSYSVVTNAEIPNPIEYIMGQKFEGFADDVLYRCNISGRMQKLFYGVKYKVEAKLNYNQKYGWSFEPTSVVSLAPKSQTDQLIFLRTITSNNLAEKLIEKHPNIVTDVMNGLEEIDLSEIKGMGQKVWERIKNGIISNYTLSELLVLLRPLGVTEKAIISMVKQYKSAALAKEDILENPYVVTKIKGISFTRADELALKLKPESRCSLQRLSAYVYFFLNQIAEEAGHTWCTKEILIDSTINNVPECVELLPQLLNANTFLVHENGKIGLKKYYKMEKSVYQMLLDKYNEDMSEKFDFSEEEINVAIKQAEEDQGFEYTDEQREVIVESLRKNVALVSGRAGCVDCDTEFFNGTEWKRISEYTDGDKVLQYNKDGSAELVIPLDYIKQKQNTLWHFRTKYGIDQCLSLEHNVVYMTSKNNLYSKPMRDVKENQETTGFKGKFITTFDFNSSGINLSDDYIRLKIAVFADGYFREGSKICRINLKKERKKKRLEMLLKLNNITYRKETSLTSGYNSYYFLMDNNDRHFPKDWYNCSYSQKKIIADEIMHWNGDYVKKNRCFFSVKSDADFIQFLFSSIGKRACLNTYNGVGENYVTAGKIYKRKSVEYTVLIYNKTLIGLYNDHRTTPITKYTTKDGYEYCFTVPSHMLVLRRNGKIFITGNCGKSTIMRAILRVYQNREMHIAAMALSAKAAQVITESTNIRATTIHRGLGAKGANSFSYDKETPLNTDLVFIDESSMINVDIFLSVLEAIGQGTRVILIGDPGQLPPIGFGNVFANILDKEEFEPLKLNKVMRQAEDSGILSDANKIRNGINPIPIKPTDDKIVHGKLQDMYYVFRDNRDILNKLAIKMYLKSIKTDGMDNVALVTPRRQGCLNSSLEINNIIEEKLFGHVPSYIEAKVGKLHLGTKVLQVNNNYEKSVFNGEVGTIKNIYKREVTDKNGKASMQKFCLVSFGNRDVEFEEKEAQLLELAHCLTTHKMQGSGYKTIIGIIDNSHYTLLDNCMLYTMLTRAKKRCMLLSERKAFVKCIKTNNNQLRQTWIPYL